MKYLILIAPAHVRTENIIEFSSDKVVSRIAENISSRLVDTPDCAVRRNQKECIGHIGNDTFGGYRRREVKELILPDRKSYQCMFQQKSKCCQFGNPFTRKGKQNFGYY